MRQFIQFKKASSAIIFGIVHALVYWFLAYAILHDYQNQYAIAFLVGGIFFDIKRKFNSYNTPEQFDKVTNYIAYNIGLSMGVFATTLTIYLISDTMLGTIFILTSIYYWVVTDFIDVTIRKLRL